MLSSHSSRVRIQQYDVSQVDLVRQRPCFLFWSSSYGKAATTDRYRQHTDSSIYVITVIYRTCILYLDVYIYIINSQVDIIRGHQLTSSTGGAFCEISGGSHAVSVHSVARGASSVQQQYTAAPGMISSQYYARAPCRIQVARLGASTSTSTIRHVFAGQSFNNN